MMSQPVIRPIPLFFEPFLLRLRRDLGYAVDIGKYRQLLALFHDKWPPVERLHAICKLLFLENPEHEETFDLLFFAYIADELLYERAVAEQDKSWPDQLQVPGDVALSNTGDKGGGGFEEEEDKDDWLPEPPDTPETAMASEVPRQWYLNLRLQGVSAPESGPGKGASGRYLMSEAWLPLTLRQMAQGWRYLRKKDQWRNSTRLDVAATVQHIAQNGLLLSPVFEKEQLNSDNLLLLLLDRQGSMTPFHHLCDRLVETARREGGHTRAQVYYFYNCPAGYVYRQPDLTEPVALDTLFAGIHPDHTNALIISDAGAARGQYRPERLQKTIDFLYGQPGGTTPGLHKAALFVAWLNPMPRHRWDNTTAGYLARHPKYPTPMHDLTEGGYAAFYQAIQQLMGR